MASNLLVFIRFDIATPTILVDGCGIQKKDLIL